MSSSSCSFSASESDSSPSDGDECDTNEYDKIESEVMIDDCSESSQSSHPELVLQNKAAELLIDLKENTNTTQVTIDHMIAGINGIMPHYNAFVKSELIKRSQNGIIKVEDLNDLFTFLDGQTIFEGVHTNYRMKWYAKEKWPEHLEFRKIVLNWKTVLLGNKVREVPKFYGYRVSFLQQLETLLQNEEILSCIDNPRPTIPNKFRSVLDGYIYQNHDVFNEDPHSIGIVLYVDDIDPTDGLSSYQGQNIRNYSWTLANIYPELRSSLRVINLLSLVNAKTAKMYRNEPFLPDFIHGLNRLSSKEGVTFNIKGFSRVFHGFLLLVIGDMPASGNIGGFKESPAAKVPCRTCFVTLDNMCNCFCEDDVELRNDELHKEQLLMMKNVNEEQPTLENEEGIVFSDEDEDNGNEDDLPKERKPLCIQAPELSIQFGINDESCLLKLNHFMCTKMFPQEIMHLFLEGVLKTECLYILQDSIGPKKLTLAAVNSFIENFDYEQWKTDKPSPIDSRHLKSGLRQNSSQILMLSSILPFIVEAYCNEAKLRNIVLLLMIFNICLAREVDEQDINSLRDMIKEYLQQFNILYPGKFVLKHHALIHLPTQIYLFGPLTEQWAMRFEAFHAHMKRLFKILHNAKNLVFSLMSRLLSRRSLELRSLSSNFLSKGMLEAKLSGKTTLLVNIKFTECISQVRKDLSASSLFSCVKTLKFCGARYEKGAMLHIVDGQKTLPSFGVVTEMYCLEDTHFIIYREVRSSKFVKNLNAFELLFSCFTGFSVFQVPQTFFPRVLHVKKSNVDYAVIRGNAKPQYLSA
ncbi:Interleukin-1 beta [Frankliniella fusca]|uniref:Interleukin-1 beta n=1 Tax=Frankliniella fusca TaxID=407009 RepID=A0AAE1IY61_9NEOP|nr:Interleukin-1 beta [Frankliniella fusca]